MISTCDGVTQSLTCAAVFDLDITLVLHNNDEKNLEAGTDSSNEGLVPARCLLSVGFGYFGLILVILLPCSPSPAISPFWLKMNA
jgi:hypothetical protein